MTIHVFSFEFVVTSGTLQGQHGTEDYAYAFESIGETSGERRYRAYRITNLGSDPTATPPLMAARSYAREFATRHGNVKLDPSSARTWPLAVPPATPSRG